MYRDGRGVKQDYDAAVDLFKRASEKGPLSSL